MTRLSIAHTLNHEELLASLTALAQAEQIDLELADRLIKSRAEPEGEEPEQYLRSIVQMVENDLRSTTADLMAALTVYFTQVLGTNMMKAQARPSALLTQAQIDEIIELIRATYRSITRIDLQTGTFATVPALEQKWREMGIVGPRIRLNGLLEDAFMAGRLFRVLSDNDTYAAMRAAASTLATSRAMQLMQQVATRDASQYFLRPLDGVINDLTMDMQRVNNQAVRSIVSHYMAGDLRPTPSNTEALMAHEVAALESGGTIQGWRRLAGELRNRMLGAELGRDWHRVAATESRFAFEAGRTAEMHERGVKFISVSVQADACEFCHTLFETDGVPKRFPLEEWEAYAASAPLNVGRKASRIGRDGGWLPVTPCHPWCRCKALPADDLAQIRSVSR